MPRLNWQNLITERCPKCNSSLEDNVNTDAFYCSDCGFVITKNRFNVIIKDFDKTHENDQYFSG